MTRFSRVLAAVDFSKPARSAFDYALALSKQHRARLLVIQAVPRGQPFSSDARERLALTAELQHRADQDGVEFTSRVQHGDPAAVILLHARSLRPDVIVLGTHQRSGLDRIRVGSVGERVAAKAGVPVLLVPERGQTGSIERFRHVAVAVDFSPASKRAIEQALALASGPADRVTLVHVVPGPSSSVPPHFYRYGGAEYQGHLVRDARRRLQLEVPMQQRTPATIHTRVVVGDPTTEIGRVVESLGADLLVVGVSERGIVSRALFGTTAARLLRVTPVPMLAVPAAAPAAAHAEEAPLRVAA